MLIHIGGITRVQLSESVSRKHLDHKSDDHLHADMALACELRALASESRARFYHRTSYALITL